PDCDRAVVSSAGRAGDRDRRRATRVHRPRGWKSGRRLGACVTGPSLAQLPARSEFLQRARGPAASGGHASRCEVTARNTLAVGAPGLGGVVAARSAELHVGPSASHRVWGPRILSIWRVLSAHSVVAGSV